MADGPLDGMDQPVADPPTNDDVPDTSTFGNLFQSISGLCLLTFSLFLFSTYCSPRIKVHRL